MNEDPNKKDLSYFACDILTCCIYLCSFIALKIPNYECTILGFAAIPWLFLWYKRRNAADVPYFILYGCIAALIAVSRLVGLWWGAIIPIGAQMLALVVMVMNVFIYGFYVFLYYRFRSEHIDQKLFSHTAERA